MKNFLFLIAIITPTFFISCVDTNKHTTSEFIEEDSCLVEDEARNNIDYGEYLYNFLRDNRLSGDDVGSVCVLRSESYWSNDKSVTIPFYIDGNCSEHKYIKEHVFNNESIKAFLLKSAENDDSLNMCIDYLRENSLALRLVIDEVCFDAYDPELMDPKEVKEFENYREEVRRFFKKDANKIVTVNF